MSSNKRQAAFLAAAHVVAGLVFLSPSYIRPDSVGIFTWLRSLVVDRDLLFFDEWAGFRMLGDGFAYFKEVTPVGALADHWWVGTSILTAPFYLLSHVLSVLLPGAAFPANGFFGLDLATLAWTSVLFHALTLALVVLVIRHVAGQRYQGRLVLAALVFASLGTPAFWYSFRMPLGTHAAGMLSIACLTWLCVRCAADSDDDRAPFLLGLTLGLAIVTRLQHAVLLPAVLYAMWRDRSSARDYGLAVAGGALPLAVQAVAWQAVYGNPLGALAVGANLQGVTWMPFRRIAFLPVLVSSWHGLFAWSPIWIPALVGLVLLAFDRDSRVRRDAGVVCLLMFGAELFANATLDRYWWGGMSFGPRRFVDLALPAAIGIWAFLERTGVVGLVVSGVATLWSGLLMLAAAAGTLDLARYLDWRAIGHAIGTTPRGLTIAILHSPVTSPRLAMHSCLAILIVAGILAAAWSVVSRRPRVVPAVVAAWVIVCLVATLAALGPTRHRAAAELARFKLDTTAARRAGPLIDQRGLISDELAWLEATGRTDEAARTRDEIARIDQGLARLGVRRPGGGR